ncbi:hypothetical protein [Aeromonas sp. MrichA-1]|uniref:hypothetical protein n=1 Tax=Aeromonas sp. MrichA-1 TaxID=2823362 RepID=UPI001B340C4E|nr:hypothetical protein [Aeromonas sp. MrichA-1]MBP4081585.1 hypothetical protein [Aeromonas sp. MrichA-1]
MRKNLDKNAKPSMMPFRDYYKIINGNNIEHDSSAYGYTVEEMNKNYLKDGFIKVVNNFTMAGIRFELREKTIDRHASEYVTHDKQGNLIRDSNGDAVMMTAEEKAIRIPNRYRTENAIFNAHTGDLVAFTADEWGCRLIAVAKEYQGLGLGHVIKMENIKHHPFGYTGGTTPAGDAMIFKCYQELVSRSLRNGEYREAYLSGKMSMSDINSILESALVTKKAFQRAYESPIRFYEIKQYSPAKRKDVVNLDVFSKKNCLFHIDSNVAIIYSPKIFELLKNEDRYDHFIEKAIKGYVYVGGVYDTSETPKLFRMYAEDEKTRLILTEIMLNKAKETNEKIRFDKEDVLLCRERLGDNFKFKKDKYDTMFEVNLEKPTMTGLKEIAFIERKTRKSLDEFDERWYRIQEIAYALGESSHEKELEKERELKNSRNRSEYGYGVDYM